MRQSLIVFRLGSFSPNTATHQPQQMAGFLSVAIGNSEYSWINPHFGKLPRFQDDWDYLRGETENHLLKKYYIDVIYVLMSRLN